MLLTSLLQRRHALRVLKLYTGLIRSHVLIPGRTFQSQARPERFRILFMGRDEFSCLVLQELYQAKDVWKEIVIATQPDAHVGRSGSILSISPLKTLGQELNIPVHIIPKSKRDFKTWPLPEPFAVSEASEVPPPLNHLLVTASFGRILPAKMLNSFQPSRRLNVHPSLLPAYRGPAPIQHTILNNETNTGVCVIEMLKKSEGIDAGSLWGCQKMAVPKYAIYEHLRDQLAIQGGQLLVSVLRDAMRGKAIARIQTSADNVPHAPLISAKDSLVNFNTMTAEDIHRRFRALSHQKPLFTHTSDGKILQLRELGVPNPNSMKDMTLSLEPGSTTYSKSNKMLLIRCMYRSILGVTTVKPEGKADRPASEYWKGLREIKAGNKEIFLGTADPDFTHTFAALVGDVMLFEK